MDSYINTLPYQQVLLYLVIGGLLHSIFYLTTNYGIPILKKRQQAVGLYWNRIQIFSWTVYLLLFFSSLFKANIYLTLAISVLALLIGWGFWINFFAGIIVKFTNQFKVNDHISTDLIAGKIKDIKSTYTEIISNKGELLIIPNSQLKKAVLKHLNQKNTLNTSTFICAGKLSYKEVYKHALNCPYVIGNQAIRIVKNKNKKYLVKATLLDESYKEDAVAYFEKV
jgi:hypothetical protein